MGEAPLDSGRKMMSVVVETLDGEYEQYTKGAPDVVIGLFTHFFDGDKVGPLTEERRAELVAANKAMADEALRVLALASRTYTVTVLNKSGQQISAKSSGGDDDTPITSTAKITGFSVLGVEGEIDQSAGTITVKLPVGANVTAVAPVVTVPAGAVVSPVSGEVVNLSAPLIYTVTLGTESKNYTVTVIFERSISQQLWDKVAENSDVADHQTSYGHRFN